jgi:hypothetical protein
MPQAPEQRPESPRLIGATAMVESDGRLTMLLSIFQFDEDSPCWSTTTSCSVSRCVAVGSTAVAAVGLHRGGLAAHALKVPAISAVGTSMPGGVDLVAARSHASRIHAGMLTLERLRSAHPQLRVLVLTGEEDPELFQSGEGSRGSCRR